jgi:hypothetical protein
MAFQILARRNVQEGGRLGQRALLWFWRRNHSSRPEDIVFLDTIARFWCAAQGGALRRLDVCEDNYRAVT